MGGIPSGYICSSLTFVAREKLHFSPNPPSRVTLDPPGWGCLASTSRAEGVTIKGPSSAFRSPSLLGHPSHPACRGFGGAEPPNPREEKQPLEVGDPPKHQWEWGRVGGSVGPHPTAPLVLRGQEQPSAPIMLILGDFIQGPGAAQG